MKCFICNNKSDLLGNIEGYVEGTFFNIYKCLNCDFLFSDPHYSEGKIYDLIYRNAILVPGYRRYVKYKSESIKQKDPFKYLAKNEYMYKALYDYFKKNKYKNKKVLEVGCGMGYLTYALNEAGHDCVGLDISLNAINDAKKHFSKYSNKYIAEDFFKIKNEKFDVICMLELIEHVSNPKEFIDYSMSLLNKNGVLYISTPQKEVNSKNFIWGVDLPEIHLSYFSDKSIKMLCDGYPVVFLRNYLRNIFYYGIWIRDKVQKNFIMKSTFNKNKELIEQKKNNKHSIITWLKFLLDKNILLRVLIQNILFTFYKNKRFNYRHNDTMTFVIIKNEI